MIMEKLAGEKGKDMRRMYSKFLIAVMILTMIGSTTVGAVTMQAAQPSSGRDEILSSVSVFAGSGDFDDWDGSAKEASFRMPQGIAVMKDGSILVADSRNHLIRQVKNGAVSTYAGFILDTDEAGVPSGGWNDGAKQTAVFNGLSGMDTDIDGNVYIADTDNHLIRKLSKDGMVSTIAGDGISGNTDGVGAGARFDQPQDVAVAADGTLYVADTLNHSIRQITTDGRVTTLNASSDRVVEVIGGYPVLAGDYADGKLSAAKFNEPTSIAIDNKGNLYVSDTGNQVIRYIDLAEGVVTTVAGLPQGKLPVYADGALYAAGGYAEGSSSEARFHSPRGIAITEEQGLVIADSLNHSIRYLMNGQVSTIAGVPTQFGQVDGINGQNLIHRPTDVAVLPTGNLLIADSYNNKIRELEFYQLPSNLPQNGQVKVVLHDQVINFDAQPEIVKGRTLIPVRALSEAMGYTVGFNDDERIFELTKGDVKVVMEIGSKVISIMNTATGNKQQLEIDAAPYIKADRTYVPIRFFSEAFGVDVAWDQQTKTVILREIAEAVEKLPLADRNGRAAKLEQIKGTVWIKQAGGSLTYRAYDGISLHQGDHIRTENNSSAVLKTIDRNDEVTIDENSELYISNLNNASQVKHTSFVLWSGLVGASVTSLVNAKDTFKIWTPTAETNVRGTNFMVGVDPVTGESRLFVNSGLVQAGGNGTGQSSNTVYPSQQLSFIPGSGANDPVSPYPIDLADIVNQASPAVIEALLKQKQKIDQENEDMLQKIKNGAAGSYPSNNPLGQSPEDFAHYQNNLNNLLANIAKQALEQKKMEEEGLNKLLGSINSQAGSKIDLENTPPYQLSEQQKNQQQLQRKLEEQRKLAQEEQNKLREQERLKAAQQGAMLEKIKAEKDRLEQGNKKQQEEAMKQAEQLLKQKLLEEQKQKFTQLQQALEQQRKQQEEAQRPKTPTPTPSVYYIPSPDPETTPTNHTPIVKKELSDKMVHPDAGEQFELNLNEVFHDEDDDILTFDVSSSNPAIAEVELWEDSILIVRISPDHIGSTTITITATDGRGGKAVTSFEIGVYPTIEYLGAETSPESTQLYWGGVGYEDEQSPEYHVYVNDELYAPTMERTMELTGLEPNIEYSVRVVAVVQDQIIAFADYSFFIMEDQD
ncbi:stalk domain-containing protein [Paenibacillus yanchengensis]|uniref:Stalk domain-containing protein n=1 Tax=Paenibacillus yanchengensis TaxID=2035833 RepID=A0ABW4YIM4_9BACL